jgi:hypothetical protein
VWDVATKIKSKMEVQPFTGSGAPAPTDGAGANTTLARPLDLGTSAWHPPIGHKLYEVREISHQE